MKFLVTWARECGHHVRGELLDADAIARTFGEQTRAFTSTATLGQWVIFQDENDEIAATVSCVTPQAWDPAGRPS